MVELRGFHEDEDDCEIIPLHTAPTYRTYEDDDYDGLPSYNEAIKDEGLVEAPQSSNAGAHLVSFQSPQPTPVASASSPEDRTFAKRRKATYTFLVVASIPGIALLIGGICCGALYLSNTWTPSPPTATFPPSIGTNELSFIILVALGMIVLYPALFWWTLVLWLPPTWMTNCLGGNRLWRCQDSQSRARKGKGKRHCCICCGLSILYFVIMIVAIVVPTQLANNTNAIVSTILAQDAWAGSYVILDSDVANGTTGLTYTRNGESTGSATFEYFKGGWSVRPSNGSQPLANIIYTNAVPNQTYPWGTLFSATCKGNYTGNCTKGGLPADPVSVLNGSNPNSHTPEFINYITLGVTCLVPLAVLNMSGNTGKSTVAMTTNQAYQGIGGVYAPLGVWTLDTVPLIQVAWSTSSFGPCQGLEVFLSKDQEGIAWLVFGLIWQWWFMWGEYYGGCINWANSYVDIGVNGVPLGQS